MKGHYEKALSNLLRASDAQLQALYRKKPAAAPQPEEKEEAGPSEEELAALEASLGLTKE